MRINDLHPVSSRPNKGPQRLDSAEIAAMYKTRTPDRQKPWSLVFGGISHQLYFTGKETIEQVAAIVNVALGIHSDNGVMLYAAGKRLFSDPDAYHAARVPMPEVDLATNISEVVSSFEIFIVPVKQ